MSADVAPSYGPSLHYDHARLMDGIQSGTVSLASSVTSASSSMSTVTPTTHVRHIYKKARYFFINRQFPDAYTTILPLISPSSLHDHMDNNMRDHIWKLYLALLDGIMHLPSDRLKDGFSRTEISQFEKLVQEGAIWDRIAEAYQTSSNLAPDMVLTLSLLCTRHTTHPDIVRVKVENYIQKFQGGSETAYSRVLEFYAMVILPACEKWDDTRKFVLSNDLFSADKRRDMLSALDRLKSKSSEARAEREAKAQRRNARRKKQPETEKEHQKEVRREEPQFGSLSSSSSKSENYGDERRSATDSCNATSMQKELIAHSTRLLGFLARSCRRPGVIWRLLEILLTIVALLVLAVPESRTRLALMMTVLWKRLRKTITMGVRVNYL
ncbi:uncharacterized protein V1513DRAFT_452187 [Lipomyces chichibuensis]|uniref:uncharacterized protein n=1 Tax=Lipomyces chichibuensis TaxID=1546026 RepID=UPI00334434D8